MKLHIVALEEEGEWILDEDDIKEKENGMKDGMRSADDIDGGMTGVEGDHVEGDGVGGIKDDDGGQQDGRDDTGDNDGGGRGDGDDEDDIKEKENGMKEVMRCADDDDGV